MIAKLKPEGKIVFMRFHYNNRISLNQNKFPRCQTARNLQNDCKINNNNNNKFTIPLYSLIMRFRFITEYL